MTQGLRLIEYDSITLTYGLWDEKNTVLELCHETKGKNNNSSIVDSLQLMEGKCNYENTHNNVFLHISPDFCPPLDFALKLLLSGSRRLSLFLRGLASVQI